MMQSCDCEQACYTCLLTFWNQRHHALLDRQLADEMLDRFSGQMSGSTSIPPSYREYSRNDTNEESTSGTDFAQILGERSSPQPEKQHRMTLDDGTTTVANFAYPEDYVVIYIDGIPSRSTAAPSSGRTAFCEPNCARRATR